MCGVHVSGDTMGVSSPSSSGFALRPCSHGQVNPLQSVDYFCLPHKCLSYDAKRIFRFDYESTRRFKFCVYRIDLGTLNYWSNSLCLTFESHMQGLCLSCECLKLLVCRVCELLFVDIFTCVLKRC